MNLPAQDGFALDLLALRSDLTAAAIVLTRNRSEAGDLVQDTLLNAWAGQRGFKPGTNLRSWVMTIQRNIWFTRWRKRDLERRRHQDLRALAAGRVARPTQEVSVAWSEATRAIGALPCGQRDAIVAATAGCSYEEIAGLLHCAVGTAKSRVGRARAALRAAAPLSEPASLS